MARIIHFADLHLDSSFASIGMASSESTRRREELRAALRRIVDLALERDVDAVSVGGDFFEHDRATLDTGRFVKAQFERLKPKPVFIAPGNHDPCVADSLYRQIEWPSNVTIFDSMEWNSVRLGDVEVWGVGHNSPSVRENLLRDLRLDGSRSTIALMHGSDTGALPEGKLAHCPFESGDVDSCGASLLLLGHYHGMRLRPAKSPRWAYPGSPEPLGFDEEGPHYVLLATVEDGVVEVEPIQVNDVNYRTVDIDVTGMTHSDEVRQAISASAGSGGPSRDIVRAILRGLPDLDLDMDTDALHSGAAERFRYLDIVDETEPAFDPGDFLEETTTRGAFVRLIQERIEGEAQDSDRRERLTNALLYGLQAFDGREIRPR